SLADGELLYTTSDIWTVCELADTVRRRLHADIAYYNINRHFNYTNVCALSCKFCEFYRKQGDDGAYTRDIDHAAEEAGRAPAAGSTENHLAGGLPPFRPFDYSTALRRPIRSAAPTLHIKAVTAVEIVHLARIARVYKATPAEARRDAIRWVLERLV